jgi:hypothetical protein
VLTGELTVGFLVEVLRPPGIPEVFLAVTREIRLPNRLPAGLLALSG